MCVAIVKISKDTKRGNITTQLLLETNYYQILNYEWIKVYTLIWWKVNQYENTSGNDSCKDTRMWNTQRTFNVDQTNIQKQVD